MQFSSRERSFLIDGLIVLIEGMKQVKANDLSELPEIEALLKRLSAPVGYGCRTDDVKGNL